jgi:hypothetical protein
MGLEHLGMDLSDLSKWKTLLLRLLLHLLHHHWLQ